MKTTGEKIRDMRLSLGLTQAELSEKTEITIRTITNYETDTRKPRGLQVRKLCEALNVSEAYLMDPEIDDPTYGLEEAPYVDAVRSAYGKKGADEMQALLSQTQALFAGGDTPQEDKDKFFEAVMEAYLTSKREASERFTNKRYKK